MRSLHTLPPWDLHQFRSYLGTASGSQSVQFRELELRSGLREPAYLKALEIEYGGALPEPLAGRLAERSLADAHAARPPAWASPTWRPGPTSTSTPARGPTSTWSARPWSTTTSAGSAGARSTWRWCSVPSATTRGTGGMAIAYLQRTTRYRFFPVLWALRDELVVRGAASWSGGPARDELKEARAVEYRRLGASGVRVSEIGLGSWLTYGVGVEADQARACVARAYELGVNFFDTADVYGRGRPRRSSARPWPGTPAPPTCSPPRSTSRSGTGPTTAGCPASTSWSQCHASLRRLRTDYLDLYQCHRFDDETPLEETLRALDDLVRQGKVHYVGVSEWTAAQIGDALALADDLGLDRLVSNQPEYSILRRRIEAEVLPLCAREGVGQVVWSPLAQGC